MTIFDEVVNGAKTAAESIGRASKSAIDISRLKISAAELKGEIEKKYEALGRLVYDAEKDGTDIHDMITQCVANIDAMYQRLEEVNDRIADAMNRRRCKHCGAANRKDAIYCDRCGRRIEDSGQE